MTKEQAINTLEQILRNRALLSLDEANLVFQALQELRREF
jgi:hypothetical protein